MSISKDNEATGRSRPPASVDLGTSQLKQMVEDGMPPTWFPHDVLSRKTFELSRTNVLPINYSVR